MTALLLTACVGMITGAFLIFRISPMDFTLGVFRRLTAGPKSIRDEINETTHRKKPGLFRREISEAQTILQATGKEERFPVLCAASLLLFAVGAGIAIIMNNLLLVPVLAAGMMFLPFWYIKLTAGHYRKAVTAELETALSIITTAYLRSEDLQTAVEENTNYLNPPVQGVFRSFLTRIKHIDPDMNAALAELKSAIDNEVWREWCEALSACQYDHSMKSTLSFRRCDQRQWGLLPFRGTAHGIDCRRWAGRTGLPLCADCCLLRWSRQQGRWYRVSGRMLSYAESSGKRHEHGAVRFVSQRPGRQRDGLQ